MSEAKLDPLRTSLIRLSAALALGDGSRVDRSLEEAARTGNPLAVEETILQSYLFLGYPVALNTFARWRELTGRPAAPGTDGDWEQWRCRGEEVCRVVYGGQYERLRQNVRYLHPEMERWMVTEGYGKVLGRSGLDLATRELCIVALLAVLDAPRQLYSHLRGARNAGAGDPEVEEALRLALEDVDRVVSSRAMEVWARVLGRPRPSADVRQGG